MEVFRFEQDLKLEAMAALHRIQDSEIEEEHNVQLALMQDRLYKKFKIEQEDYNLAINFHKLNQDEEV